MEYTPTTEQILRAINSLKVKKAWKLVEVLGVTPSLEICRSIEEAPVEQDVELVQKFLDLGYGHAQSIEMATKLVELVDQLLVEKYTKKLEEKQARHERRMANRACYLPEPILRRYETKQEVQRWRSDTDLRSGGLLPLTMRAKHPTIKTPYTLGFLNLLPIDPETERQLPVQASEWNKLNANNVAVSGGRLGWNMNTPAWMWLLKAFPNAIDMAAYNHSLNAPVYPDGFLQDIEVIFKKLVDVNGQDLKTDGSGIYHPECEQLKTFVKKHGACPIQFRFTTEDGLFSKGVLFPSELAVHEGKKTIVCDFLQVKGVKKATAKKLRVEGKVAAKVGNLGIIGYWNRPGKLKACFELLENLQVNDVTAKIVQDQVELAMDKLAQDGIEGLIQEVARDDEKLKLLMQMITSIQAAGFKVDPTTIPMVRAALKSKLGKRLWHITQGAGMEFDRYVMRLDDTVPAGKCVISGFPGGVKVVGFRFPIVLAQGLVSMETIEARPQDLIDGQPVPYQIVGNSSQFVLGMQGDDDGDTMGISTNPAMLELFQHLVDTRVYQVEPVGTLMNIPSESPEGLQYLQDDRTGVVGMCTLWRAQLLAVGDIAGANAISIATQENLDCAKKKIIWSDFRAASDISNWNKDSNGVYHFKKPFIDKNGQMPEEFPVKDCAFWVKKRVATITEKNPIAWRNRTKRINIDDFHSTEQSGFNGGNLVHVAHNAAHELWQAIAEQFMMNHGEKISLANVLPELFRQHGVEVTPNVMDAQEYQHTLWAKSGLKEYNTKLESILSQPSFGEENETAKYAAIGRLSEDLAENCKKLSIQELIDCWYFECSQEDEKRLNNAFRLISWEGSPVAQLLGIEMNHSNECSFLTEDKVKFIVEKCMVTAEPQETLANLIYNSKAHAEAVKDDQGEGIPGYACKCCIEKLEKNLISKIRDNRARDEVAYVKKLVPALNGTSVSERG